MSASIFSVLMTFYWSSLLITACFLLRTRTRLLHICSISTVIMLYLFCAIRLVFPVAAPWVHVISGGMIYNRIYGLLARKIGFIRIYELLFAIWMIGILCNLIRYWRQYYRAVCYFRKLPQEESRAGQEIIDGLDSSRRIKVMKSTIIKTPCCIGIFQKRIFLPVKTYGKKELRYILIHEYAHLVNNDILLKVLIEILCGIYWWNPLVYLLRKDLNQSMEIRCDLSVTRYLKEKERADYLEVMLETFCDSGQQDQFVGAAGLVEEYSESLLERFRIVADMRILQEKRINVFTGMVMLLVLIISYSYMLQSAYEAPLSEIETDAGIQMIDQENAYIIKQGNTYILHTVGIEKEISEEGAQIMLEEGFTLKEIDK